MLSTARRQTDSLSASQFVWFCRAKTPSSTTMSQSSAPSLHWTLASVVVCLLYLACGWLGLLLSVPPGFAAPLYPAAGLALAFALVFGWRVLPAVAVGAMVVNAFVTSDRGLTLAHWWVPVCIGLGSAAQAGFGLWAVRRWVRQPMVLSEPRDIGLFFLLGGAVACLVSASCAALVLGLTGVLSAENWPLFWLTWWMGDTFGVLVAAPILLTLIGRPRADWAPRRLSVGLSLLVALGLLAVGINEAVRDDTLHAKYVFDTDTARLQTELNATLKEPLQAVQSVAAFYRLAAANAAVGADPRLTSLTHQEITRPWVKSKSLGLSLSWAEPVGGEVPTTGPAAGDASLQLRFVQTPTAANGDTSGWMEGFNLLSLPFARDSLNRALLTGETAVWLVPASGLGQAKTSHAPGSGIAALLFQPVFVGEPSTAAQRSQSLHGVVVGGFRIDALLKTLVGRVSPTLEACVLTEPAVMSAFTALSAACEKANSAQLQATLPLEWPIQGLQLRVFANTSDLPQSNHFGARALELCS
jgi:MASE1/CHASE domain